MIGRMRPFYQARWDISKDIKHVWLLFVHITLHGFSVGSRWGGEGERWRDRKSRVWTPRCVASWVLLLHMQEVVFVDFQAGPRSSRGGGGPDILAPGLHTNPHQSALGWAVFAGLAVALSSGLQHLSLVWHYLRCPWAAMSPARGLEWGQDTFTLCRHDCDVWRTRPEHLTWAGIMLQMQCPVQEYRTCLMPLFKGVIWCDGADWASIRSLKLQRLKSQNQRDIHYKS